MTPITKLDEKLEGAENFWAWKYRTMLILQENDLDEFVKVEVPEPEGEEVKAKFKKDMIRTKRIIADSIKDHLIPHVSPLETPMKMYDAFARLFESQNINQRMTLRTQLKNVKVDKSENVQAYLSRVSQIKEQLHAIGDMVEEEEVVMTTLNGLPRSWESFIQGVCSRRKMPKFNKLWEGCIQEEAKIAVKDEKLGSGEDHLLPHTTCVLQCTFFFHYRDWI